MNEKVFLPIPLILMLFVCTLPLFMLAKAPVGTNLYANPASETLSVAAICGDAYTFGVMLENAQRVTVIDFCLSFDPSKVNITSIARGNALPGGSLLIAEWNATSGVILDIMVCVMGTCYDVDNKTVVTVTVVPLDVTTESGTLIDIWGMSCWDWDVNEFLSGDSPWDHTEYVVEPAVRDGAVLDVRTLRTAAYVGDIVDIDVDVQNHGNAREAFCVRVYADTNTTVIGDEVLVGSKNTTLSKFARSTIHYIWDTTGLTSGNYTLTGSVDTLPGEVCLEDNNKTKGVVQLFEPLLCPDINIMGPANVTLNPSIFEFNWTVHALQASLGNVTIDSTGFEGLLRVVGSANGTVRLRVDEPSLEYANHYLPLVGSIQVPLWLLFEPGTCSGVYELELTVCGLHRVKIIINIIDIWVCQNGCFTVGGGTASFNWTLTGGSWVYLEAEAIMPLGWTYAVDPEVGILFETPHAILVNITAPPDAKEGEMGIVTLRAYKNATKALIWQFVYFSSTDNHPPTIESIEEPILSLDGTLSFNTTVKDLSGISDVLLRYSVDYGPWQNQAMNWALGDSFNSTQYSTQIPIDLSAQLLKYRIIATDYFGNQTLGDIKTVNVVNDVAITVTPSKTVRSQGGNLTLNVTLSNKGTLPLDLVSFSIFANSIPYNTVLTTQSLQSISNGTSKTLSLTFNTSAFSKASYMLAAYTPYATGDKNGTNNYWSCALVITIIGDFNGDFKVGPADFAFLSAAYGSTPSMAKWNPNCDVNDDDKVGPADFAYLSKYYGQHYP